MTQVAYNERIQEHAQGKSWCQQNFHLKDESREMHSDFQGLVSIYRRHNYIYLLRFKMLMEPIIIVFIKLMGAAISGHWDLGLRETMTLLCGLLGGSVGVRPIPCPALCLWHAEQEQCGQILQPSLPHKKRHILASRTCSAANMAVPTDG